MEDRQEILLQRAGNVFYKYGIRSVSMDDICSELGISKKTLYQYVGNKEELVQKIVELEIKKTSQLEKNFYDLELNAIDSLFELSKLIGKHIKEIHPNFLFDLKKYYPSIYDMQSEFKKKMRINFIRDNIIKGIQEGFYREDIDIALITKLYVQKLEFMRDPELFSSGKDSFSRIFKVIFENHIRAISNPKGIKYLEQKKKTLNFKF